MKHKLFIFLASLSVVLFASCHRQPKYNSGEYWYTYYLVNKTSSPITLEWLDNSRNYNMAVRDTTMLHAYGVVEQHDDLFQLHRPSLTDGYEGQIQVGEWILTYQDKKYKRDDTQENSFMNCANYQGYESPMSVFIYDYYFNIDEEYISTLPLLE